MDLLREFMSIREDRTERWPQIKKILESDTALLQVRDSYGYSIIHAPLLFNHLDILRDIVQLIQRQYPECQDILEKESNFGVTPIMVSTRHKDGKCFNFLVQNCPSGTTILDKANNYGFTVAHYAAVEDNVIAMKLILKCYGLQALIRLSHGGVPPLRMVGSEIKKYFAEKKIPELVHEYELIPDYPEPDSLVSLMLGVLKQNTEICFYRLVKCS